MPEGPTRVGRGQRGEALGEDAPGAVLVLADEAADLQGEDDASAAHGAIRHRPLIAALDAAGACAAQRATAVVATCRRPHSDGVRGDLHLLDPEVGEVWQHGR